MIRQNKLTVKIKRGMDETVYADVIARCGIQWTTSLETTGNKNCRRPKGEPTSLPDGKGYQVLWVENPDVELYRLLFTDFPDAVCLANMNNLYCDDPPHQDEVKLTMENISEYMNDMGWWHIGRRGTYDPPPPIEP